MTKKETMQAEKPDPEVNPPVQRRTFSEAEKLRILEEADACTERGEIGALVRREGIYRSYLSRWRRTRAQGKLDGSKAKKRGPRAKDAREMAEELEKLRQENERLQTQLRQAETIIEVQKKLSQMLGLETSMQENTEIA
jgi:transposase-like protein